MMIYEYKCLDCDNHVTSQTRGDKLEAWCPHCPDDKLHWFQRVWSISVKPMMHEHFNHTLGKPIGDMNRFATELRIAGEKAEEQTGIPHRYAPLEYGDHEAFGATGEGIYESNVDRSRRGEPLLPLIE